MKRTAYALAIAGWTILLTWYAPLPLNGGPRELTRIDLLIWAWRHGK